MALRDCKVSMIVNGVTKTASTVLMVAFTKVYQQEIANYSLFHKRFALKYISFFPMAASGQGYFLSRNAFNGFQQQIY